MAMPIAFSKDGAGVWLADSFNQEIHTRHNAFPNLHRGHTLAMIGDFGGQHKGQLFDTYAFLTFDVDRNRQWFDGQRLFRKSIMPNQRRMSFKAMNDSKRRQAIFPFLDLANCIDGWLVSFAISKCGGTLFDSSNRSSQSDYLLTDWKPNVRERLLRILHLSAFLLSGLSAPGQEVLWFIDEDEIASNVDQLTQLTTLFATISSNSLSHGLGHMKCGTAKSDDGTLSLEDLVAICDFAAGAFSEIATSMANQQKLPRGKIMTDLPAGLSWKSRLLATWLADDRKPLQRISFLIERNLDTQKARIKTLKWHAFPGDLLLPRHPFAYQPR